MSADYTDCDVVVEALIREHLTKKKCIGTLASFKQEQQTLQQPINKRSILQGLLGLKDWAAATGPAAAPVGDNKPGNSTCSTLELLVQQQLLRTCRPNAWDNTEPGSASASTTPLEQSSMGTTRGLQQCGMVSAQPDSLHQPNPNNHQTPAGAVMPGKEQQLEQQQRCLPRQLQPLMHQHPQQQMPDHLPQKAFRAGVQGHMHGPAAPQQAATVSHPDSSRSNPQTTRQAGHDRMHSHLQDLVLDDVDVEDQEQEQAAADQAYSNSMRQSAASTGSHLSSSQQHDDAISGRLLHTANSSARGMPSSLQTASRSSASSSDGSASKLTGSIRGLNLQALTPEQQRQLSQLMWEDAATQPEPAWQQGFIWCSTPGLEWGLVQLSGGPCGVLAAVQAHLAATLMDWQLWDPICRGSSSSSSSPGQQRMQLQAAIPASWKLQEALISSLALILWNCCCSNSSNTNDLGTSCNTRSSGTATGTAVTTHASSRATGRLGGGAGACSPCAPAGPGAAGQGLAYVAVLPPSSQGVGVRGLCDARQLLNLVQVASATSLKELEALVCVALPQWSQPKGWGLLLFVHSALLSRGVAAVKSDMDSSDTRLVDGLGYCSMELVNLLLTGTAVSNVFDGMQQLGAEAGDAAEAQGGGIVLKGVAQRARVGLLTLFEWYRYVEVGQNLKSPRQPVWVVCSESHFSVLALAGVLGSGAQEEEQQQQVDTQVLQPLADSPLLLQYYDGLVKQDGPVQLELQPARFGQGWSSRLDGVAEERGVWRGQAIPPLECVLETKWRDVAVKWHGCDPIL